MRFLITIPLISLLFFSAACGKLDIEMPPPSPHVIQVATTPSILPLIQDQLEHCNQELPGIEIILESNPNRSISQEQANIIATISNDAVSDSDYTYQIATLEVVFIAHPELANQKLSLTAVQEAYSSPSTRLPVWTYPENHELRLFLDEIIFQNFELSPNLLVAPTPGEMIEAVASVPGSIGYVPKYGLPDDVETLRIDLEHHATVSRPILAISRLEPHGLTKDFLTCLQSLEP